MIKTTYRTIGLTSCLLLTLGLGGVSFSGQTYAQAGLLSPSAFSQNPASLFTAPGGASANTLNLLTSGVQSGDLANTLMQSPMLQNTPVGQISGLLDTIKTGISGGGMTPEAATSLLSSLTNGAIDPAALQGLANIPDLGKLLGDAGNIQSLFNNPAIQNLLGGKPAGVQAALIDNLLDTALKGGKGAVSQLGADALQNIIKTQMPDLAAALDKLGPLGGLLAGGLGSLFGGSGTGAAGGGSSSGGGSQDTGNYELQSMDVSDPPGGEPCGTCAGVKAEIADHYKDVRQKEKDDFIKHRTWMVNDFWKDNVLPAMMLMAEQLSVVGIQQVEMFGAMLDAKHQLETQRLFEQLTAEAHKDYHPSEGMCTFGTTVRSLAASERKSNLVQIGLAGRMMQRQTLSGDVLSFEGPDSDIKSRLAKFITTYCDKADNANGLGKLCPKASAPERHNIDVDYTRNVESRLTLDIDMTQNNDEEMTQAKTELNAAQSGLEREAAQQKIAALSGSATPDQEDLFALAANLYSHNVAEKIMPEKLGGANGQIRQNGAEKYLDLRAIYAKRSVAQNSFAAITAMRASGDNGSAPYTKALIKELGIADQDEIEKVLGKNPSYFAQMEVLTKKIYQNPTFYTELYDKPVNVERKGAAIQAISLMQDRDLYNSLLRSEAVLSVLLETMLDKEQAKVTNAGNMLDPRSEGTGEGE